MNMEPRILCHLLLLQISVLFLPTDAFYIYDINTNYGVSSGDLHDDHSYLNSVALNDVLEGSSSFQKATEGDVSDNGDLPLKGSSSKDLPENDIPSPASSKDNTNSNTDLDNSSEDVEKNNHRKETPIENVRHGISSHKNWPLLDNKGHCGRSKRPHADKTIGGKNADLAEYPWMARLIYRFKGDKEMGGCGGSIINSRYILTAAHCCPNHADDGSGPLAIVRLGEYDVHRTKDCFQGECAPRPVEAGVQSIIKHYNYSGESLKNDICLIRLSDEVKFNDYIQPICLPVSEDMTKRSFIGTTLTLAGWGEILSVPDGRIPDVLQEVRLRVVPGIGCEKRYAENYDAETMLCAGGFVGRDACAGDSGGPLMYADAEDVGDEETPRHYEIGLVSSGLPCSNEDGRAVSGVYTRVSSFIPWILDSIEE